MSIDVLTTVAEVLERRGLLGKDLLVGVSGGLDSVCLYRLLCEFRDTHGGRLEVAHVDHGRRATSATDASFCRALADRNGSRFHVFCPDARELAAPDGFQGAARRVRRRFFEEVLQARGLDCVVLGHHADDQVETVLYRLLRGAGLRGAAGMEEYVPPYLRPLLGVRRSDLEALATARGWEHREDPTNRTDHYARNRVRHEVLPALRRAHPGADAGLLRFARLAADDDRVLTRVARDALQRLRVVEPEGVRLRVADLKVLEAALRRRIYLALWQDLCGTVEALHANHLEAVDALLEPGKAHRFAPVPGPGSFAVSYDHLWLLHPEHVVSAPFSARFPGRCGAPLHTPAGVLHWTRELPGARTGVAVPGDAAEGVTVRSRRAGDRVLMPRPRKIKDLLIEARVPLWRRSSALVLQDGPRIFGVLGRGFVVSGKDSAAGWVWLEPPCR